MIVWGDGKAAERVADILTPYDYSEEKERRRLTLGVQGSCPTN